jgi:hypothetical protein
MYVKIKNNDVFKTKSINGNPFKALVREREREREREKAKGTPYFINK